MINFKQQNRETKLVSSLTTKQLTEWNFSSLIPWIGEWDRSHLSLLCVSLFPYRSLKIQHWLKLSRTELRRLFLKLQMVIVIFSQNVYFSCIYSSVLINNSMLVIAEIKLLKFKPSIIAASALLVASKELLPLQFPSFKFSICAFECVNEVSPKFHSLVCLFLHERFSAQPYWW